ncbi:MAG: glycosyl hydrolase [Planctomycetota bacterium]
MIPNVCLIAIVIALLATFGSHAAGQPAGGVQPAEEPSPFDPAVFADPPNEYRPLRLVHGIDRIQRETSEAEQRAKINETLTYLSSLGIGGIVANVGSDDYLMSEAQWEFYRQVLRAAHEKGLVLWLYDEKGYPSGTAGGVVTRANPGYLAQGLACYTTHTAGPAEVVHHLPLSCWSFEWACAFPRGTQPTAGSVRDISDQVDQWGTLRWSAPEGEWTVLYMARRVMYEGTFSTAVPSRHTPTRPYIDTLNEDAVRAFLRVTHEQYARRTPAELWEHVRAVFTDEPLIAYHYTGGDPRDREDREPVMDAPLFTDRPPAVPWTDDLPEEFRAKTGYELRPHLYALFTSSEPEAVYVRQGFWDVVTEMYAHAYFEQIADWCAEHGTALSGHVLAEESMWGNLMFEGSLMRAVRPMQIPGIDILTADPEAISEGVFVAAKAVSSAAHLTGKKTVHCECCAFRPLPSGEKLGLEEFIAQANMLHVMGVNLFTLYQNQRQIGEEAFRRYTDYAARLSLLLRGGRHVCDIAVLYPDRSGWAWWTPSGKGTGPEPETDMTRHKFGQVAASYGTVCRKLAQRQLDFDIVDERAIHEAEMREGVMRLADEAYGIIVLPRPTALELHTAEALAKFCTAGGRLISVEQKPRLADSEANQGAFDRLMDELFGEDGPGVVVPAAELPAYVRSVHAEDLQLAEPNPRVFYTHRRRDGRDLYFIVNNDSEPVTVRPTLRIPGPYRLYRPLSGEIQDAGEEPQVFLEPYEGAFLVTGGSE